MAEDIWRFMNNCVPGETMKFARCGILLASAVFVFAFSMNAGASGDTQTPPEAWIADPDGLRKRFVSLFDEETRPLLHGLVDDAMASENHYRDDFIRYMALVAMLAENVDARLFFLVEAIPGVLRGERRERRRNLSEFFGEMHFRTSLLLEGPAGDGVGDGAPEQYEFTRDGNGSTLFLDRTPEPGYNRWKITYTARSASPDETVGVVVHDAGDRYGTYPGAAFMRVREGRIFFTTPRPAFEDFYADPANAPRYAGDGRSFHSFGEQVMVGGCPEGSELELDAAEIIVFFDDIAADGGRMRASLFQINRDAYVPAIHFQAQCVLFYEWDGYRYVLAKKECVSDGEWGVSRCGELLETGR